MSKERSERLYEPAWKLLKATGRVEIEVPPAHLETIKKAIKKEKTQDLAFKVMNDFEQFRLKMQYDMERRRLVIYLVAKFGFEQKVVV